MGGADRPSRRGGDCSPLRELLLEGMSGIGRLGAELKPAVTGSPPSRAGSLPHWNAISCGSEPAREGGVSFTLFGADILHSRAGSLPH